MKVSRSASESPGHRAGLFVFYGTILSEAGAPRNPPAERDCDILFFPIEDKRKERCTNPLCRLCRRGLS